VKSFWKSGVLTAVITNSVIIFWDVTSYNLMEVYRRFGGRHCLIQGQRQTKEATSKQQEFCLLFDPEDNAVLCSETSVNICETTHIYIPEDDTVHEVIIFECCLLLG
jgi:hypothetical protein